MKKQLIAFFTSCLLLSAPTFAAHPMCGKTDLADVMGNMKDSMKAIKKSVKMGDVAKVTELATSLLNDVDKAQNFVPLAISDKKELTASQQSDLNDYKDGMKSLKTAVSELAGAQDLSAIKAALGKIGKASKKGHKAFKMDCDE